MICNPCIKIYEQTIKREMNPLLVKIYIFQQIFYHTQTYIQLPAKAFIVTTISLGLLTRSPIPYHNNFICWNLHRSNSASLLGLVCNYVRVLPWLRHEYKKECTKTKAMQQIKIGWLFKYKARLERHRIIMYSIEFNTAYFSTIPYLQILCTYSCFSVYCSR